MWETQELTSLHCFLSGAILLGGVDPISLLPLLNMKSHCLNASAFWIESIHFALPL